MALAISVHVPYPEARYSRKRALSIAVSRAAGKTDNLADTGIGHGQLPWAEGVRAAALARLEQLSAQPVRRRPVNEGRLHRALKLVYRERLLQEGLAGRELDAVRLNLVDIVR